MSTKEPVTTGGWYENTDGTVTKYRWDSGMLKAVKTVGGWAEIDPPPDAMQPSGPVVCSSCRVTYLGDSPEMDGWKLWWGGSCCKRCLADMQALKKDYDAKAGT